MEGEAEREGARMSDGPHAQRRSMIRCVCRTSNSEPRLSPRRKPGTINTGLWDIGPGFRRGDSELWLSNDLPAFAAEAGPAKAGGSHVQRGGVYAPDSQFNLTHGSGTAT